MFLWMSWKFFGYVYLYGILLYLNSGVGLVGINGLFLLNCIFYLFFRFFNLKLGCGICC